MSLYVLSVRPQASLNDFGSQYILADAPSNLVMRKIGSIWLSFLVLSFGLVTLGSTWMRTRTDMYLNRIFLGMTEGGVLVSDCLL